MRTTTTLDRALAAASQITVKSALNPALWFSATTVPVCFFAAYMFRHANIVMCGLLILGSLPIFLVIIGFFYFMLKDPDRLHSEKYQLKKLEILSKGKNTPEIVDNISIAPSEVNLIENKQSEQEKS